MFDKIRRLRDDRRAIARTHRAYRRSFRGAEYFQPAPASDRRAVAICNTFRFAELHAGESNTLSAGISLLKSLVESDGDRYRDSILLREIIEVANVVTREQAKLSLKSGISAPC